MSARQLAAAPPLTPTPACREGARDAGRGIVRRESWAGGLFHLGLVLLVLAEIAVLRAQVDTESLPDGGWAGFLRATRFVAPIGITFLAAWIAIGRGPLVRAYRLLRRGPTTPSVALLASVLHLAVFASAVWLTRRVFALAGEQRGAVWGFPWGIALLLLPPTALAVGFSSRSLRAGLRSLAPSAAVALTIGLVAFGLGRAILESGLWFPLAVATTRLSHWLLEVVAGESQAGLARFELAAGGFRVLVTRQCSGFEGIGLTWTFLAVWFLTLRRSLRFPHVLVLVPIATVLVWFTNGVRLALLAWIGDRVSADVAMGGFHSNAGWIAFCGLSLGLVAASRRIRWFQGEEARIVAVRTPDERSVNPAAVCLAPLLAVLAVTLLTGAFSAGFDALYPLRVLAGVGALWWVRSELPRTGRVMSVTGVTFGVLAAGIWLGLDRLGVQHTPVEVAPLLELPPLLLVGWLVARTVGFLLVMPVVEELAFRGFLARRLVRMDFERLPYRAITPLAWCLSSLAFGLMHRQWIAASACGALYGLAVVRGGRLADGIVAHITTNLLLILASLCIGPWHAWL